MDRFRKVASVRLLDVLVRPSQWLYRVITLRILLIAIVLFGIYKADAWFLTSGRPVIRDAVIMWLADKMAGGNMPLRICDAQFAEGREDCDLVYSRSDELDPGTQWGLVTNSPYLTDWTTKILANFTTENIIWGRARGPLMVAFVPRYDPSSFHVSGQTDCSSFATINERHITFESWNDEKDIISTLTHELIHYQLGNFCVDPRPLPETCVFVNDASGKRVAVACKPFTAVKRMEVDQWFMDSSVWVESHTESATIEVLAAMCRRNGGQGVECRAFWNSLGGMARGSLYSELKLAGLGFMYEPIRDVLVYNKAETVVADKSFHDYSQYGEEGIAEFDGIVYRYRYMPWNRYVVPGIISWVPLDTGNRRPMEGRVWVVMGMLFDDTRLMLGPLGRAFLWAMTP